jgi:hypothetical protein
MAKTKRKTVSAVDVGSTRLLGQRELELLNYLHQQFPATVGHIPLAGKIHLVYQSGMDSAADIVRERARLLSLNNCKDTVRKLCRLTAPDEPRRTNNREPRSGTDVANRRWLRRVC